MIGEVINVIVFVELQWSTMSLYLLNFSGTFMTESMMTSVQRPKFPNLGFKKNLKNKLTNTMICSTFFYQKYLLRASTMVLTIYPFLAQSHYSDPHNGCCCNGSFSLIGGCPCQAPLVIGLGVAWEALCEREVGLSMFAPPRMRIPSFVAGQSGFFVVLVSLLLFNLVPRR